MGSKWTANECAVIFILRWYKNVKIPCPACWNCEDSSCEDCPFDGLICKEDLVKMMTYGVYAIYDSAAGVFTAPTIDISDRAAVRNFQMAIENGTSVMNFKPDDFVLYQIGTFDVETGKLDPWVPPSRLVVGKDDDYSKEVAD